MSRYIHVTLTVGSKAVSLEAGYKPSVCNRVVLHRCDTFESFVVRIILAAACRVAIQTR